MGLPRELTVAELYRKSDPAAFDFQTTRDLSDGIRILGQPRAVESVRLAVGMKHPGYNLFALGPPGTGRQFVVRHFLEEEAARRPVPPDYCYLNDFSNPNTPKLLELPAGVAIRLKADIDDLIEEISTALAGAFESEEYQARLQAMQQEFTEENEKKIEQLQQEAQTIGLAMLHTPMGIVFAPQKDGEVMSPDAFNGLPEEERKRIESSIEGMQKKLQGILRGLPRSQRELRNQARKLNEDTTDVAIGQLIGDLKQKYADFGKLREHLDEMRQDLIGHARELLQGGEGQNESPIPAYVSPISRRYRVNVLVDNSDASGAPVIYEDHPVYESLVGRIEHMSHMGTLVTDFSLIRAGALHQANGGFLVLDARRVLMQPYAWDGLKRALTSRRIRIESPGQALGLVSTVSLEPEPAPLDIKVVLLGDQSLYYLLCAYDPDFAGLFKVAADFDDRLERNTESEGNYAHLIAELIRKHSLRPFDRDAVARVIEESARWVGDSERLSTHVGHLSDLLLECDHWTAEAGTEVVDAESVQRAIEAQTYRVDRVRERLQEGVLRGTVDIRTEGMHVGQVNGLAVLQLGTFAFGKPSRITARIRLGKGEVVNIEREVELSGPIHSKGVLILGGFLSARYASDSPLSLSATLVFEQSYGGVDGDSASSTELYALLSAISGLPVRQSLAVTGSVNQYGQVQAIGGANEKIEGFFDLCRARGLTGDQGVLIPATNVKHLMLRHDVVEAVRADQFHIYAVHTIDEGIELLTGVEAGTAGEDGQFPPESVNGRVARRLQDLAEKRIAFARAASGPDASEGPEASG
jgi:lon-related putative ATP-dependent protease